MSWFNKIKDEAKAAVHALESETPSISKEVLSTAIAAAKTAVLDPRLTTVSAKEEYVVAQIEQQLIREGRTAEKSVIAAVVTTSMAMAAVAPQVK